MGSPRVGMARMCVDLSLDAVDSRGGVVQPLDCANARPSALSIDGGMTWYGFVLNDSSVDVINPGQTVSCWVSFFNDVDSVSAFPIGASALFGDGVSTRGVIRIKAIE